MRKGPFWLAAASYLLPTFPLGYFWHLVTFHEQYERLAIYRPDVVIPFGFTSMVIQALIFAAVYPRLFDTARDGWWRGALGFFIAGSALSWSFTTVPVAAKFQMTSVPLFLALETGFTLLQFAVVSPLMALAWRQPRRMEAAAGRHAIADHPSSGRGPSSCGGAVFQGSGPGTRPEAATRSRPRRGSANSTSPVAGP